MRNASTLYDMSSYPKPPFYLNERLAFKKTLRLETVFKNLQFSVHEKAVYLCKEGYDGDKNICFPKYRPTHVDRAKVFSK